MQAPRWGRFAAGSGVLFFVFAFVGLVVTQLGLPGADATDAEVVAYFEDGDTEIKREVGSTLVGFGVFFLLVFLGSLRSALRQAEGGGGTFASIAFAGGAVMAAFVLLSAALETAVASADGFYENFDVDPDTAIVFQSLSWWIGGFTLIAGGVMVGATSVISLKTAVLPRWFAIAGLVLAAIAFFGETAMSLIVPILLVMLWVAVVSAIAYRRGLTRLSSA